MAENWAAMAWATFHGQPKQYLRAFVNYLNETVPMAGQLLQSQPTLQAIRWKLEAMRAAERLEILMQILCKKDGTVFDSFLKVQTSVS